jgi:hypothetical protein
MGVCSQSIFANDLAADVRDGVVGPLRHFVEDYFSALPDQIALEGRGALCALGASNEGSSTRELPAGVKRLRL